MSVACGICHLPNEVVERIFFHFGFGPHPGSSGSTTKHESGPELEGEKSNLLGDESGSSSNQRTGSMLEGVKLNFTVDNCAGMSLALTSKRFLEIFRKSISGIFMTNKYRFGVGTDGNVRSITAVVGDNLDELRIEDSKYVADQTVRALIRYCPNLRVLDLLHTPSIGMYDLADLIKARCRSLESVSLRNGVYAGDAVLVALGKHCELLRVLVIQGTECEVTPGALMCALAGSAGTLRRVSVDNVFGRQLSLRAVLPPWGLPSTPVFRHLESFEVKNVSWVNGNDAYVLTKALIVHAPQLKELKISPDSRDLAVAVMSDEQIADLKASIPEFVATVWKNHDEPIVRMYYGFDPANSGSSNEGVPQEVLLGPGEAGPA